MRIFIDNSWKNILNQEFNKEYFVKLKQFLDSEYENYSVFPKKSLIFNAFNLCNFDNLKVVIIGQDPYHGKGQANGLAFSVNDDVKIPPSLKNIYKEIYNDLGKPMPTSGNLSHWARQGVLLLNAVLTVRENSPASHRDKGWEIFTDRVIQIISEQKQNIVFLLWGNFAKNKARIIDSEKHHILTAVHPSPFSANNGFFGCSHFSETNRILTRYGKSIIRW